VQEIEDIVCKWCRDQVLHAGEGGHNISKNGAGPGSKAKGENGGGGDGEGKWKPLTISDKSDLVMYS